MSTLLLQCVAPLQAWDTQSRFGVRTTGREPSKSGIVGLLCAALGRPRWESVADLAELRMAVRVDKEGRILRDFHTAKDVLRARASGGTKDTEISTRYYLSDSAFLVALTGARDLLTDLQAALKNPHWMLYLGRKACPPSSPVYVPDGLQYEDWQTAFKKYPWLGQDEKQYEKLERVRWVTEDDNGPQVRHDHPLSFEKGKRQFALRRILTKMKEKPPFRDMEKSITGT